MREDLAEGLPAIGRLFSRWPSLLSPLIPHPSPLTPLSLPNLAYHASLPPNRDLEFFSRGDRHVSCVFFMNYWAFREK